MLVELNLSVLKAELNEARVEIEIHRKEEQLRKDMLEQLSEMLETT